MERYFELQDKLPPFQAHSRRTGNAPIIPQLEPIIDHLYSGPENPLCTSLQSPKVLSITPKLNQFHPDAEQPLGHRAYAATSRAKKEERESKTTLKDKEFCRICRDLLHRSSLKGHESICEVNPPDAKGMRRCYYCDGEFPSLRSVATHEAVAHKGVKRRS